MFIQRLAPTFGTPSTVVVRHDQTPQNHNVWHSHEELEFISIKKGRGTFFVGDCIHHFTEEFTVLIGSNTPHYWLFDEEYVHQSPSAPADIRVVHFRPDFIGADFFLLPEASHIKQLYQKARRALIFEEDTRLSVFFDRIVRQAPFQRLTALLETLGYIAGLACYATLVSPDYTLLQQEEDLRRMNKVMEYIRLQYKAKVRLEDVAQLAGMTSNSFCRYFKQRTGKTLVAFLHEIRVGQACKMLTETSLSIKEICFDCGFQNFVSFHKIFKTITRTTPSAYREAAQRSR